MIRAIIGSGGKTSLIKKMAEEFHAAGKKVFVTTSTHMMQEADTWLTDNAEELIAVLEEKRYVMAGIPEREKIRALSKETYEAVCKHADEVLVEADGSKGLPFKFPAAWEPVICENVEEVILVTGLYAMGRTVKETVHRYELAEAQAGIRGDQIVDAAAVQTLLRKGYLEHMDNIKIKVNHDGSLYQRVIAKCIEENMDVSLVKKEWFQTQPKLIICGGGHVSLELARMAASLDLYVRVIDDREEFANRDRFPTAEEVCCDSFSNLENYLEAGAYYVVVTRGHQADYECVEKILASQYEYLGMIGSRKKVAAAFTRLREAGFAETKVQEIHAPIGLSIGANTPAEIAISILAEIIQEKNQKYSSFISKELAQIQGTGTLCIITKKTGSSPRGEGSMMFVSEQGIVDTIGGGAIEHAVIEEAKKIEHITVKEYHLDQTESAKLGMICGGSNEILFIPLR